MPRNKSKSKNDISIPITNPKKLESINNILPTIRYNNKENIIFSYKYFKCASVKNNDFNNCFKNILDYAEWITFCLDRLSNFSTMSIGELGNSGNTARFHPVEDKHLAKLKGILKGLGLSADDIFSQDESQNYYELSFGTGNGRMFGYLIDNIYFVLLLDPNHLVYINASKGAKNDLYYKNYKPWEELLSGKSELRR